MRAHDAAADTAAAVEASDDWDGRLSRWPRAHLLQTYGWGALQETVGWRAERLEVEAGGGRRLPLTVLSRRAGPGPVAAGTVLYVPRGPACGPGDTTAWQSVRAALEVLAESRRAVAVTVEPWGVDADRAALAARLPAPDWTPVPTVQPERTAVVDLRGGDDAVLARMRPKGRYNVRLAIRRGVEVTSPADPAAAAERLGRLCAATASRQGIVQPSSAHLRRVLDLVPSARVHLAVVEGEDVSGAMVVDFAGCAVYLYGGSTERFRERQPSALLHYEAMRAAAARGCDRYDLWGIPPEGDPAHPWSGLRQFKLSLGGVEEEAAGAWRRVRRPLAARAASGADSVRALVRQVRRTARTFGARRSHPLQSRRDSGSAGDS